MECWIQWATLVSPIISVVAIIVALCVARSSSKDAQRQITAIHNLLDVFVAANNLDIVEAQRKYQRQLAELDRQIEDAQFDVDTVYPFVGGCKNPSDCCGSRENGANGAPRPAISQAQGIDGKFSSDR